MYKFYTLTQLISLESNIFTDEIEMGAIFSREWILKIEFELSITLKLRKMKVDYTPRCFDVFDSITWI